MADILLVPNYEVGNGIGKAATLFGGAKNAGVILGLRCPSCWCPGPTAPIPSWLPSPPAASCPGGCTCPDQTAYIEESMLW